MASLGCASSEDFIDAAETICESNNTYDLWETYTGYPDDEDYRDL
jgi:hypothetical protein